MGYHLNDIEKGVLGEISKIREELDELQDAAEQGCKILALVELSDLVGAIRLHLEKYHPTITLADLAQMSMITERAFKDGTRK